MPMPARHPQSALKEKRAGSHVPNHRETGAALSLSLGHHQAVRQVILMLYGGEASRHIDNGLLQFRRPWSRSPELSVSSTLLARFQERSTLVTSISCDTHAHVEDERFPR